MFTGCKDVDFIILEKLTDKDLLNVYLTEKRAKCLLDSDLFWYNRLKNKFPYFLKIKPLDKNHRDYYKYIIIMSRTMLKYYKENKETCPIIDENVLKSLNVINYEYKYDHPICWAARCDYLEMVKFYSDGCSGNDVFISKELAFMNAVEKNNLEIVKYLVEKGGVSIHTQDNFALRNSSRGGRIELMKYSIEKGANIHVSQDLPLRCMAMDGNLEMVKYLLEKDADPSFGLDGALFHGHLEIFEYLINNGARMNIQTVKYLWEKEILICLYQCLEVAIESDYLYLVKYLLKNGAKVDQACIDLAIRSHASDLLLEYLFREQK